LPNKRELRPTCALRNWTTAQSARLLAIIISQNQESNAILKQKMIIKGSRVRHKNEEIDKTKGIMLVFEIKNEYAICGYGDFDRLGQGMETYKKADLKLSE
jgi:hypothetical protein